jgi:hypothetical protein
MITFVMLHSGSPTKGGGRTHCSALFGRILSKRNPPNLLCLTAIVTESRPCRTSALFPSIEIKD